MAASLPPRAASSSSVRSLPSTPRVSVAVLRRLAVDHVPPPRTVRLQTIRLVVMPSWLPILLPPNPSATPRCQVQRRSPCSSARPFLPDFIDAQPWVSRALRKLMTPRNARAAQIPSLVPLQSNPSTCMPIAPNIQPPLKKIHRLLPRIHATRQKPWLIQRHTMQSPLALPSRRQTISMT